MMWWVMLTQHLRKIGRVSALFVLACVLCQTAVHQTVFDLPIAVQSIAVLQLSINGANE